MGSILTSVRKGIGIEGDITHFDPDLIMHTNATFAELAQMGIGPKDGFIIEDVHANWDDFMKEDCLLKTFVKQYVPLKVKTLFDPSASSQITDAYDAQLDQLRFRMRVEAEPYLYEEEVTDE